MSCLFLLGSLFRRNNTVPHVPVVPCLNAGQILLTNCKVVSPLAYYAEAYVVVTLVGLSALVTVLRAAGHVVGVPTATFDNLLAIGFLRGCPFPTVAPKVDTATGSSILGIGIHSCQSFA